MLYKYEELGNVFFFFVFHLISSVNHSPNSGKATKYFWESVRPPSNMKNRIPMEYIVNE